LRIRCERCATIYELDEKRLPPHGALVKCTRCDHVFRAAPPVPGSDAAPPPDVPGAEGERAAPEERTALFGFSTPGTAGEQTATLASAPGSVPPRHGSSSPEGEPSRPARPASSATRSGRRWQWMLVAALLAALALALGWYVLQSRVATPTTRLPAGAELLPT
jgi:predicted Zn finger-like uncharacterized protein